MNTLSDAELNSLVAEKVAGWCKAELFTGTYWYPPGLPSIANVIGHTIPPYATSADAVLPLLEKERKEKGNLVEAGMTAFIGKIAWVIRIVDNSTNMSFGAVAPTFARAACLSLLKAHGINL